MKAYISFLFVLVLTIVTFASSAPIAGEDKEINLKAKKIHAVMNELKLSERMGNTRKFVYLTRPAEATGKNGKGVNIKTSVRNYCVQFAWCLDFGNCEWNAACAEPCSICGF